MLRTSTHGPLCDENHVNYVVHLPVINGSKLNQQIMYIIAPHSSVKQTHLLNSQTEQYKPEGQMAFHLEITTNVLSVTQEPITSSPITSVHCTWLHHLFAKQQTMF